MNFVRALCQWQKKEGRHHLPWQHTHDPYKVWLSEIMLQQTQVSTVMDYYDRFLERFPTVVDLAQAPIEQVLELWSGLGYYARARNLHKAAQTVVNDFGGHFPSDPLALQTLSGIGRSTAHAIAAFCFGTRTPIMDGNVKRIFTRYYGIFGVTSQSSVDKQLWDQAYKTLAQDKHTDMPCYTQALMDLGATLCTRNKPQCSRCPVVSSCFAYQKNMQSQLPTPKPKKVIPHKETFVLVAYHDHCILLEQRPMQGIWGGLLSLPQFDSLKDLKAFLTRQYGSCEPLQTIASFEHIFSHFKLKINPVLWMTSCTLDRDVSFSQSAELGEKTSYVWKPTHRLGSLALPAPIKNLLVGLYQDSVIT